MTTTRNRREPGNPRPSVSAWLASAVLIVICMTPIFLLIARVL
jgi:hypothetical protein